MDVGVIEGIITAAEHAGAALTTGPGFAIALLLAGMGFAVVYMVKVVRRCETRANEEVDEASRRYDELLKRYELLVRERFEDYRLLLDINRRDKGQATQALEVVRELTGRIETSTVHGILPGGSRTPG